MTQTCPSCAAAATGRFCSDCGAALEGGCPGCEAPIVPGGRFCNQCGTPVSAASVAGGTEPRRTIPLPWVAGLVAVAVIVTVALVYERESKLPLPPVQADAAAAGPAGGLSAADLAAMPPREAADRLFNRVMQGVAAGDTEQLPLFTEMAIQAYARVPERDADLHFHLGELYRVQGDAAAVRAQSDSILARDPDHLFGLAMGARARAMEGDEAGARALYARFLDGYAGEIARDLPEYREHAPALPGMRAEAEAETGR